MGIHVTLSWAFEPVGYKMDLKLETSQAQKPKLFLHSFSRSSDTLKFGTALFWDSKAMKRPFITKDVIISIVGGGVYHMY